MDLVKLWLNSEGTEPVIYGMPYACSLKSHSLRDRDQEPYTNHPSHVQTTEIGHPFHRGSELISHLVELGAISSSSLSTCFLVELGAFSSSSLSTSLLVELGAFSSSSLSTCFLVEFLSS